MPTRIGDKLPRKFTFTTWFFAAAGIALVSAWGAIRGTYGWGITLAAAVAASVFLVLPWLTSGGVETVYIDERGVFRIDRDVKEHVRWEDIKQVRIVTTDAGPWAEDVFFMLEALDGTGCCVAHGAAVRAGLLEALQAHLPGVDDNAVIRAMGSTSNNSFVIWERTPRGSA